MVKDPRQQLLNALKLLREDLRSVTEGILLRKEGEMEALAEYLQKLPSGAIKDIAPRWLRETRELKLKPAKGRLKDLKKIDLLLCDLLDGIITADAPKGVSKAVKKRIGRPVPEDGHPLPEAENP